MNEQLKKEFMKFCSGLPKCPERDLRCTDCAIDFTVKKYEQEIREKTEALTVISVSTENVGTLIFTEIVERRMESTKDAKIAQAVLAKY